MNYVKKHAKQIIITFTLSIIAAYLLSLNRSYPAFGGEDLLPIAVIIGWLFKFIDDKERNK